MILFKRDIETDGKCLENNDEYCSTFCRKFLRRECAGARYIREEGDPEGYSLWVDQEKYPYPMYKEEQKNDP